jgi:hypothetical protein
LLATQNPGSLALESSEQANVDWIRREQGQGDAQDHTAQFGVITANLGGIVFQ